MIAIWMYDFTQMKAEGHDGYLDVRLHSNEGGGT
jgi:hypothetical protein